MLGVKLSTVSGFLLGLAALAALSAAGWFIYRGNTLERTYTVEAAKAADQAADRGRIEMKRDCGALAVPEKNKCESQIGDTYRSYRKEARDLEAQRTTALWTAYMGAAALIGMALSMVGVALVFITFRATREANEIAKETAYRELRAYLSPVEAVMEYWKHPRNNEVKFRVTITVENSGATPAIIVADRTQVKLYDVGGAGGNISKGLSDIVAPRARRPAVLSAGVVYGDAKMPLTFSAGFLLTYVDYLGRPWTEVVLWVTDEGLRPSVNRKALNLTLVGHYRTSDYEGLRWSEHDWEYIKGRIEVINARDKPAK